LLETVEELVGVQVVDAGRVARLESGPYLFAGLQVGTVPTLVGGVLTEIRQHLEFQGVPLSLETDDWFEQLIIFRFGPGRLSGRRFFRTVSFVLQADVDAGETGVAVHRTEVVVRLAVGAADGHKVIRTGLHARTAAFSVGVDAALAAGSAYHQAARIYSYIERDTWIKFPQQSGSN